jgi:hypothetical protein
MTIPFRLRPASKEVAAALKDGDIDALRSLSLQDVAKKTGDRSSSSLCWCSSA